MSTGDTPPDDETAKHRSLNRNDAESKLRRGGRHCPVCLAPLAKNAARTRLRRDCVACGAHPSTKRCARCASTTLWEGRSGAGCRACGLAGPQNQVIGVLAPAG
jgi:hypothetical protein